MPTTALTPPRRLHRTSGAVRPLREKLDGNEILISLALLGEATKPQLLTLHFPNSPLRRIERHLQPLLAQGLIERRSRYAFDTKRGVPVPNAHAYRLSPRGHELVADDARYPVQTGTDEYRVRLPNPDTTLVLEHDLLGTEAISWLVAIARDSGMSGMFLRREQQLDPQARAPRIDAVLVLHFGGPQLADGAFVWTKNPPVAGEARWPLALEIDRNTEAISVIRGKAIRYQEALTRQRTYDYWHAHYGRTPVIVWVAPTERRLEAIHRVWMETWPQGDWALATTDALAQGWCLIYTGERGVMAQVRLFAAKPSYLGRIMHSWPAHGGLQPVTPAPPALPPPPTPLPLPPPPPDPEEEAAAAPRESAAAPAPPAAAAATREAVAAPAPPAWREITLSFAKNVDQPLAMPVPCITVIALSPRDIDLRWEGRLWLPHAGLPALCLEAQFVGKPLMLRFPDLQASCHVPADATQVTLDLAWPMRPLSPDRDERPWVVRAGIAGWRCIVWLVGALRDSEVGMPALVLLVPAVLALLVTVGMALWLVLVWLWQTLWALLAALGTAVWAGLIWVIQLGIAAAVRLVTMTEPIGGRGVALMLFLATIGAVMWLVAVWEQLIDSIREHWDMVWRLVAIAVVIGVAGQVIWRQLTGGG